MVPEPPPLGLIFATWGAVAFPFIGAWRLIFDEPITGALDLNPALWTVRIAGTPFPPADVILNAGRIDLRYMANRAIADELEYFGPPGNFTAASGRTFGPFVSPIPIP